MADIELQIPLGRPRLPRTLPGRLARAATDGVKFGLPTAAINYFCSSPKIVDPEFMWDFFCRRRNPILQRFVRNYPPAPARRKIIMNMMDRTHASGIEYHYDVSNEFYRLFLDRKFMFYSCADFLHANDTLEQAQLNKANHLLSLIDPQPGEKILELGCGWGSMLRHIHSTTGDKHNLYGYTLSKEQKAYIEQNFGFNVVHEDFTTADLGENRYDKIYSIGALEHIRPEGIEPLLRSIHRALKPGGRLVQHFFSLNGTDPLPISMISAQLSFPGSRLSLHSHHLTCAANAGFRLVQDTLHDYRPTLRAWFDRLTEEREKAIELVGVRMTNKYLAFFASSWAFFDLEMATLHRLVLVKD